MITLHAITESNALVTTLALIFGLIFGSFLTVVITRYPRMLKRQWQQECTAYLNLPEQTPLPTTFNLAIPRSHCPHCAQPLKLRHNIPLIGYLLLRGKCAHCQQAISGMYPLIEILTSVVTLLIVLRFPLSWKTLGILCFCYTLICLSFIDYFHQILPDLFTLSILWLGLVLNATQTYTEPQYAILGAAMGYALPWASGKLFQWIRGKQGMGYGDFKMLAMVGAWFGILFMLNTLLLATFIALIVALLLIFLRRVSMQQPLPFGPYIAIAAGLSLLYGTNLLNWITQLTRSF